LYRRADVAGSGDGSAKHGLAEDVAGSGDGSAKHGLAEDVAGSGDGSAKHGLADESAAEVALHVLAETLALAHPVIPFVTEEIWGHVPGADGLLMAHRWPERDAALVDAEAEAEVGRAIGAVQELRGWRDRVGAAAGALVPARLDAPGYERTAAHVARLARIEWRGVDGEEPAATVSVPGGAVLVLPSDAVDLEAEARRAESHREHLRREIGRAEGRLANQGFVAKAPPAVVEAERGKLAALRRELEESEHA
jgi:valyl-tRNA synthetase